MVINAMMIKYTGLKNQWSVMGIWKLEWATTTIDISTLDALIHGSLWDPRKDVRELESYVDGIRSCFDSRLFGVLNLGIAKCSEKRANETNR